MSRLLAVIGVAIVALALPAAAQASYELSISQAASAKVVDKGGQVSFAITVANGGTEAAESVFVDLYSLRGHGQGVPNPYKSVTTSQGSCKEESGPAYGYYYYNFVCELGPLATGASAHLTAVVEVNESMNHFAALLPNAYEGGYQDHDNSNNEAIDRVIASSPPTVSGSKKIKLSGLPTGCASTDFTLHASTRVKGVKKMRAGLYLGINEEGEGNEWQKVTRGSHLSAKVPVSRLTPELNESYELKIKAKRGGAKPLEVTVTFQAC